MALTLVSRTFVWLTARTSSIIEIHRRNRRDLLKLVTWLPGILLLSALLSYIIWKSWRYLFFVMWGNIHCQNIPNYRPSLELCIVFAFCYIVLGNDRCSFSSTETTFDYMFPGSNWKNMLKKTLWTFYKMCVHDLTHSSHDKTHT